MGIFDLPPPERRVPADNHATLIISWWCTGCALFFILLRVFGRLARTGTLFSEDKIMACAIIPLLIRQGLVHVVLIYGTNNTTLDGITQEGIYHRSIGARVVLASRIFYAMFIWISKLTVSEFLKRLTTSTWNKTYELVLRGIRLFLLLTFIGVVIATLAECHPFSHYYQVTPDPGPSCRNGFAQLFTMGLTDIITDVVLIAFPVVVIMRSSMILSKKITTVCLYSLGAILIFIAAYRIYTIVHFNGLQQRRSLWASIEILASAAAANAVIIGSFIRDRGVKKQRYRTETSRTESVPEIPSINRTLTRKHWGTDSDEDLFKAVGGRMSSLAHHEDDTFASPPVVAGAKEMYDEDYDTGSSTGKKGKGRANRHASESLALEDPGGLLPTTDNPQDISMAAYDFATSSDSDLAPSRHDPHDTVTGLQEILRQDRAPSQAVRPNGRTVGPNDGLELQDAGGLLRQDRAPPQTLPPNGSMIGSSDDLELQDAGGLLRQDRTAPQIFSPNGRTIGPHDDLDLQDAGGLLRQDRASSQTFSPYGRLAGPGEDLELQDPGGLLQHDRGAPQILPPNGRLTSPGDDLELHDPGGLLR